jgi:hypothetical protein
MGENVTLKFIPILLVANFMALEIPAQAQQPKVESPAENLEPKEERQPKPILDPEVPSTEASKPTVPPEPTEQPEKSPSPIQEGETRGWRAMSHYQVLGNFAYLDLLIPAKLGLSLSYNRDADRTYELEYVRGSVSVPFLVKDLGAMTDQRLTLMKRSYFGGNSFNLSYGVSYMKFDIKLGNDILSRMGASYASVDVVSIQSWGLEIGIGNRWIFNDRFVLGVDWVSWTQPIWVTDKDSAFLDYVTDANDRHNVETAIDVVAYFPRFSVLKLQFGMAF